MSARTYTLKTENNNTDNVLLLDSKYPEQVTTRLSPSPLPFPACYEQETKNHTTSACLPQPLRKPGHYPLFISKTKPKRGTNQVQFSISAQEQQET